MNTKTTLPLFIVVAGTFALMTSPAHADANVDCNAYAKITVDLAKEAKQRACKFTGPAWSLNFNFHKKWCQRANVHMADLTQEDRNRKARLQQCKDQQKSKDCDAYAKITVKLAKEAKHRGCKFTGPVWSLDSNFHKKWCQKANVRMADLTQEDNKRKAGLQQCKDQLEAKWQERRAKEKACLAYAHEAQKLRDKINKVCKSGGAWPQSLKTDVDDCKKKGGAENVQAGNVALAAKVAECELTNAKLKQTKVFPNSGKRGVRSRLWLPVDHCRRKFNKKSALGGTTDVPFGDDCGKAVADMFCVSKGYAEAIEYPTEVYDNGSNMDGEFASTYWIGSGEACHGPCRGFSSITCKGKL